MNKKGLTTRDLEHLTNCLKAREEIKGPRVGDYVITPWSLGPMRFSHDWGNTIQISSDGSFHLDSSGHCSFSGGLEPAIDKSKLTELFDSDQAGRFWIWKEGRSGAHRGVDVLLNCRTYYYKGEKP